MNSIIWLIACNRLFVLMSPWGGLPRRVSCVYAHAHAHVRFFLRVGIPENPDLDE